MREIRTLLSEAPLVLLGDGPAASAVPASPHFYSTPQIQLFNCDCCQLAGVLPGYCSYARV